MRLSALAIIAATFAGAAGVSLVAAGFSVTLIEENTEYSVRHALDDKDLGWAEVEADGLQVLLRGTAETEADRFKALSAAGQIVDSARVIDNMTVAASKGIAPPRFSIEVLRNDSGISLIGLIPTETDREALVANLSKLAGDLPVTDLLESANYPVPEGWDDALAFGLGALKQLPRSKISVDASRVAITAMSASAAAKRALESDLHRRKPPEVSLALDISSPRPVITPFTLRFLIDEQGARFDACSANNDATRARILKAAAAAGLAGQAECTIGLGMPSPTWAEAVELALAALKDMGQGSVTFSDADVSLVAAEGTPQADFDRVVGALENSLPPVFALHSVLLKKPDANAEGPPEFIATLSPEGQVVLRGRLRDEALRTTVNSFAKARFGGAAVHNTARLDENLPMSWPLRVLAGLDVLAQLSNGAVVVTADNLQVSGNTGNPQANAEIARFLSEKLGEKAQYDIKVVYQKKLDPILGLPTPEECEADVAAIQATRKINFEPGSDKVDAEAGPILDEIAEVLKKCEDIRMEVAGYTDSQGRDTMNQELSQSRAESVIAQLRQRRVLTASYVAKGYGKENPIADNGTEAGREANRRIEFRLIRPETTPETKTTLESLEESGSEGAVEADQATGTTDEQD